MLMFVITRHYRYAFAMILMLAPMFISPRCSRRRILLPLFDDDVSDD